MAAAGAVDGSDQAIGADSVRAMIISRHRRATRRHLPGSRLSRLGRLGRFGGLAAAVLALAVTGTVVAASHARASDSPCPTCRVRPDPSAAAYQGSLLLPAGTDPVLTAMAARCDGCSWLVQPQCRNSAGSGDASCVGAANLCPRGAIRMQLFLLRPTWVRYRLAGGFCAGPGLALAPVDLEPGIRAQFVTYLPALSPSFEPRGTGIVNLPTLFAAGQPASIGRRSFPLGGHQIDVQAATVWHWDFGDGAAADFASPGGPYPDRSVTHSYRRQQTFRVSVTATWSAQFWVDGVGPFAVAGPPITQTASLALPVRQARAVLVG